MFVWVQGLFGTKAGLELTVYPKLAPDPWESPCLSLLSAGITLVCYHSWLETPHSVIIQCDITFIGFDLFNQSPIFFDISLLSIFYTAANTKSGFLSFPVVFRGIRGWSEI